jgi:hypothetical protein
VSHLGNEARKGLREVPVPEFTALNLLPSMATVVAMSKPSRLHTTMNSRQTLWMAEPLFLRKSAMVLSLGPASRQPHHLDIAQAFPCKAAA